MFKRKSTPPTISPLAPPQPQQGNRHSQQMNGHSLPRTGSGSGSQQGHPQHPQQQGQGLVAGPAYGSGGPVDRVGSYDSSTMKSEKSDRRRSGFFGFGKKDKDKDKDKEHRVDDRDKDLPQPRPSFSVDRNQANHQLETSALIPGSGRPGQPPAQPQAQAQAQYQPGTGGQQSFQPYPMHQFPPPRPGQTPPSPIDGPRSPVASGRPQSQQFGQSQHPRVASNPQSPPTIASNDFGPYPSASQLPRSQTMGFSGSGPDRAGSGSGSGGGAGQIPETHPYRGFLNGQQDQDGRPRPQSQSQMPRSGSMPLDKPQPLPPSMSNGNSPQQSPNVSSTFSPPPHESPSEQPQPKRNSFSPRASQPTSRQTSQINNMPTPQTIQQPPIPSGMPQRDQPNWQREFNTVVDLIAAQPNKHYVASPPELEMILARTSAGALPKQGQPGSATNDWDAVWLQLSGISLSMWSMKETRAAAAKGEKVPPTYFNITDSSLELLAPLPPPPHRPNSHAHHFVYSLNTAGSNRLLFSCPSERDLARWATGLRLAAWERARLEEIYTGHLIKTGGREPKMELVKGRMEGWVRVRVMGGTDWKRLWLVLSAPYSEEPSKEEEKKSKRRSIFGFGDKPQPEPVQEPNTGENMASFYTEPRTQKNRTTPAVLTITNITQSYAVFPERLEVMSQSNLMKVVGRVNGELVTIEGRLRDSGWALIMPEASEEAAASAQPSSPLANMMRWVTAFHDVFGLYGRPERYIWDRTNPKSFFFAYPEGPDRNNLFLDTDDALLADFRTASLPAIRASFVANAQRKMLEPAAAAEYRDEKAGLAGGTSPAPRPDGDYRLPPLAFDRPSPNQSSESQPRSLTPITERTDDASRQNSTRTTASSVPFDRRPSDGVSKQDSGSSARKVSGGEEARLAPITDEGPGHFSEDPTEVLSPQESDVPPLPTPVTQTTLDSQAQTQETQWSQDSADQSGASTPTTTHPHPGKLAPLVISPQDERGEQFKQADRSPDLSTAKPALATEPAVPLAEPIPAPIPAAVVPPAAATGTSASTVIPPMASASTAGPPRTAVLQVQSPTPRKVSSQSQEPVSPTRAMLQDEPAAMYLMNMVDEPQQTTVAGTSPNQHRNLLDREKEERVRSASDNSNSALPTIGRKPSGARAPPPKKASTGVNRTLVPVDESAASPVSPTAATTTSANHVQELSSSTTQHDLGEDASAYMAYAEQASPEKGKGKEIPPAEEEEKNEPRSSFVLSKTAAERRARAEAAAAEQERAMYVPGGGKRTGPARDHTWSDSDEDEDDEDDGSPEVQTRTKLPPVPQIRQQQPQQEDDPSSLDRSTSRARALPVIPPRAGANGSTDDYRRPSPIDQEHAPRSRPHSRSPQPTMLEQQYRQSQYHGQQQQQQQHPRSQYEPQHNRQSQAPPPQQPQTTRQSVWNANFAAEHGMPENKSGKFIELEDPSTQLTKAFSPHGLLQVGLQDKEDRSAKRQEQLARETGSSLINVPAKPPPPQTGLLGAVAAHERERKNAGGIGATLTDREREKRLNEDRQREQERNNRGSQMDPMRQYGGDPYGGQQQYPYGMPPMMMGMPPGMPPMPYGGYQSGYNPYAQQQAMMAAQMAYQQALMSMSQHGGGGSQAGHGTPDRSSSPASQHHQQHLAPPGAGGGFGGYYPPPQMSPYGWPGMMWGGGSPAPGSPMGPPGQSPGVQGPGGQGQGWFPPPPHIQHEGAPRSRGPSMYSDDGGRAQGQGQGEDRDRSRDRDRGPVN